MPQAVQIQQHDATVGREPSEGDDGLLRVKGVLLGGERNVLPAGKVRELRPELRHIREA